MSYYYLIASLPALAMDKPPISDEAFLSRCESELSPRDYETLQILEHIPLPEQTPTHPFVEAWNNHETQLRNAIAKMRASKRKSDAERVLRSHGGYATIIEDSVENAWVQANPLERERSFDKLRWKLVNDLEGPDPFSFNVILSYAIKRKIAERWSLMDSESGWQKAQEAFEQQPAGTDRQQEPETASTQAGA